jgi:putative transposase
VGGLAVLGVEALSDMKRGKQRNRGKQFRKALAPWTYRRVLDRIGHKAQENRVRLVAVPPAYTSQMCPACGKVARENRRGENFRCIACHHTGDADFIGATNILVRTLETVGSVESPMLKKSVV